MLLARGESLCVERDMVSLEYERSERSDRSERGDDERPLLLLLRGGLAEPLWRRFLSTAGDKYLRWKKEKEKKLQYIIALKTHWFSLMSSCYLSFLVGVSSFSFSFFRSFNRVSAFSFSFFSRSFSRSSFSFSFSYGSATTEFLNCDSRASRRPLKPPLKSNSFYLLQQFVSVVLHLLLNALSVLLGSFARFQLILELHDFHLGAHLKREKC